MKPTLPTFPGLVEEKKPEEQSKSQAQTEVTIPSVPAPKKRGPAPKPIDLAEVERLAADALDVNKIKKGLGVHSKTVSRRLEADPDFREAFEQAFEKGNAKVSAEVSQLLLKAARKGGVIAAIFLAKQPHLLNFIDEKSKISVDVAVTVTPAMEAFYKRRALETDRPREVEGSHIEIGGPVSYGPGEPN